MRRNFKSLAITCIFLLSLTPFIAEGQTVSEDITYFYTSGQAQIETSNLVVKVTSGGNVPQYFFWAKGAPETSSTSLSSNIPLLF